MISQLQLSFQRRGRVLLADGSENLCNIYETSILWNEKWYRIPIDEANTAPLLGMKLLQNFRLNIDVIENGIVSIQKL